MSLKPRVHLKCPANARTGAFDRIIEFGANLADHTLAGGLISFHNAPDCLKVEVYGVHGPVRMLNEEAILRLTDDILDFAQKMINHAVADGQYAGDYIEEMLALRDERRKLNRDPSAEAGASSNESSSGR